MPHLDHHLLTLSTTTAPYMHTKQRDRRFTQRMDGRCASVPSLALFTPKAGLLLTLVILILHSANGTCNRDPCDESIGQHVLHVSAEEGSGGRMHGI
jgi:hypothetical protein